MNCPLCETSRYTLISGRNRDYALCENCQLVFVLPEQRISVEDELARYDLHDNTVTNTGYVKFLSEVADIALAHSPPQARILDFGCGRQAVAGHLLRERGYSCFDYDPLYERGTEWRTKNFDTVIICEVIEHLRDPRIEFAAIRKSLSGSGCLVIRTRLYRSADQIPPWWYAHDRTHICFYSLRTLHYLAGRLGMQVLETDLDDVFVFEPLK